MLFVIRHRVSHFKFTTIYLKSFQVRFLPCRIRIIQSSWRFWIVVFIVLAHYYVPLRGFIAADAIQPECIFCLHYSVSLHKERKRLCDRFVTTMSKRRIKKSMNKENRQQATGEKLCEHHYHNYANAKQTKGKPFGVAAHGILVGWALFLHSSSVCFFFLFIGNLCCFLGIACPQWEISKC